MLQAQISSCLCVPELRLEPDFLNQDAVKCFLLLLLLQQTVQRISIEHHGTADNHNTIKCRHFNFSRQHQELWYKQRDVCAVLDRKLVHVSYAFPLVVAF